MNKSELIRKTAKIAGAPEADASLFFEIFIRSAADILNPGDVVQIKDLGFLHYKIAKAGGKGGDRNLSVYPDPAWVDLIIFSESSVKISPADPLYFAVPPKYELDFAEIDAPFSLSLNKPVIQQAQKKEAYFIPQSYGELVRLLESKAARLLVNAKVIKNETKENQVFIPAAADVKENAEALGKTESQPYPVEEKIEEPGKEVIPGPATGLESNEIEEPKEEYSPEEKDGNELISPAPELLDQENKEEMIPPGEISAEKIDEAEENASQTAAEIKDDQKEIEHDISGADEELQEQKIETVSGEEPENKEPETKSEETHAGVAPDEIEKPAEQKEIEKLLSKGSFGANIPWKLDDISIIEPGKREESQAENAAEEYPEEENNKEGKDEGILNTIEPSGEPKEETGSIESEASQENIEQTHSSEVPETPDEIINAESFPASSGDKPEYTEKEKPLEETEFRKDSEEFSRLTQEDQPGDENSQGLNPQDAVHEAENPQNKRDFSDTEGMISPRDLETNENTPEHPEISEETRESPEKPDEEQDYEVIKPVKLKYDWKEGYLKENEELPARDENEKEEEKESEIPDEEGYIEIKPAASKEKIDFLAESEEEGGEFIKEEKPAPVEDQAQKDLKEYISKIEEIDKETSHKRRNTTILAVLIFLLFVSIGVFLYYQYIFKKSNLATKKSQTVVVKNAKTINRDFEIPVTYPYNKNENKTALYTQPIDSSIVAASRINSKSTVNPPDNQIQNSVTPQEPAKLENLGNYIFRQGNDYIVQISSFETQTRAEAQVSNLKKAKYDAYVRPDKRPDGTSYFAVMIRGFKSYDQAKNFLK